jgi:organic radical activating enzyme
MKYPLAERFKAPQGEGVFAGVPMAFMRTVGCSVGKGTCTACDTDFDRMRPDLGGGAYTAEELVVWAQPYRHVCVTGGEPLDRDLRPLVMACADAGLLVHVETSGTVHPAWLDPKPQPRLAERHAVGLDAGGLSLAWRWVPLWVTVSPKPGWLPSMVSHVADELKVILGGLGDGQGWPTIGEALAWAEAGRTVYVQPRNHRDSIDADAMGEALETVDAHPQLRLSTQLHKYLRTR